MQTQLLCFKCELAFSWRSSRLLADAPEAHADTDHFGELSERGGFDEISVGAELVGSLDVFVFPGSGEDNDGNDGAIGTLVNPLQDIKAIMSRHFEIGVNEEREGMLLPVIVRRGAGKIINGFLPVVDKVDVAIQAVLLQGDFQQQGIVRVIFDNQNGLCDWIGQHTGKPDSGTSLVNG